MTLGFLVWNKNDLLFLKGDSYTPQSCVYLIKNAVKTGIL